MDIPPQPSTTPLTEGIRAIEATGANLDCTTGAVGVATAPVNEYQNSAGPLVGGRFSSFKREWLEENGSNDVSSIIINGCILPFINKLILARQPMILSGYIDHQKDLAHASCIQSLLTKNAVEKMEKVKSLGLYSCPFLVPNPHHRWRPVIDISRLNTLLKVEKFRMETPKSIRASLTPREWSPQ